MNTAELNVAPVASKQDLGDFLDLPDQIYRDDPNWVPPLRQKIARQLSPRHPFRSYGNAQPFVARRDGKAVGRIVAAVNRRLIEKEGRAVGLFGYFECIDDRNVAGALLEAACRWLRESNCVVGRGPIDLSTHINCLFLVDGFDTPPHIMMPYNPRFYPGLVEAAGWRPAKDAYAYDFPMTLERAEAFERSYRLALSAGIRFRPMRLRGKGFEADCRDLYRVFTQSFSDNWSSTPRSEAEFLEEARDLRHIADPNIFPIAEHDGRMIGFWMGLPDINLALRHVRGRLNAAGLLKLLWHRRKIDRLRVLAMAILPEYRRPLLALGPALIYLGMRGSVDRRIPYRRAELSWVWEDNRASRRLIEVTGAVHYKTYRIYEKALVA